jgi:hypothetical protein
VEVHVRQPRLTKLVAAASALACFACARGTRGDAARHASLDAAALREISNPAAPGSGEANLAVAPDGRVLLSWIEPAGAGHALRFAALGPEGRFGEARGVAEGTRWFANFADFPALAATPDGTFYAHWLERTGAKAYAYGVRVAVSKDDGASWGAPAVPHTDAPESEHGFVSMVPAPEGGLALVWLDGRASGEGGHGQTALFAARIAADGSLGPETLLDERVCDCCQTAAAVTSDGLRVAYRDRGADEVRDVSVVRYAAGRWSAPRSTSGDGWRIDGCPVNGPALAAAGGRVALAWHTAAGEAPHVKVAFSDDGGVSFGPPAVVDDGRPVGRVDVVLLDDGTAVVSWIEQVAAGAELRARPVRPRAARAPALRVADSSSARSSGFPRLERSGGRLVFAWRDAAEPPRIHTALLEVGRAPRGPGL